MDQAHTTLENVAPLRRTRSPEHGAWGVNKGSQVLLPKRKRTRRSGLRSFLRGGALLGFFLLLFDFCLALYSLCVR